MRHAVGLAVLALGALLSGSAASETRPAWADLPIASIPAPPDHTAAPQRIDPSEHADGLSIERDVSSRRRPVTVRGRDGRCLAANVDLSGDRDPSDRGSSATDLRFSTTVSAVRSERIAYAADGKASLEIVDVWVDPQTLGSRELSRTSIPLARIGRAVGGVGVYGFRTGDELEVVVPLTGAARFRGQDGEIGFSQCGDARVSAGTPDAGGAALLSASVDVAGVPGAMTVSVSVSKLSRDPAPVVSVAATWSKDEPDPPRPLMSE